MVENSVARQAVTQSQPFHILSERGPKKCHPGFRYLRRTSPARSAVTSSGTLSCCRAATASAGCVCSTAGRFWLLAAAQCAGVGHRGATPPPTWLWGTCARPSHRAESTGRPTRAGSSALSTGRNSNYSARRNSCPSAWCARPPKHTRAMSVCHSRKLPSTVG